MRKVLVWFTIIQLALVLLQFYLATFGAFERPVPAVGSEDAAIGWHAMNGFTVMPLVSLITVIVAAIARAPGRVTLYCAAPLVAMLLQLGLFELAALTGASETKTGTAGLVILGFHAIVGVVMLGAAILAWRGAQAHAKGRLAVTETV